MRSRLALKVEGLARVSKNAGGRPRLASVAFDGRIMGLILWQGGTARPQAARLHVVVCILRGGGAFLFTATPRTRKEFLSRRSLLWLRGRTKGALRAERYTLTSANGILCFACHELLCSRALLLVFLRSAQHPQIPRFWIFYEEFCEWLSLPWVITDLLCLRNARAFPLLPAALASVPFGFVLVRVRVTFSLFSFHPWRDFVFYQWKILDL